jgi:hypothetical protein
MIRRRKSRRDCGYGRGPYSTRNGKRIPKPVSKPPPIIICTLRTFDHCFGAISLAFSTYPSLRRIIPTINLLIMTRVEKLVPRRIYPCTMRRETATAITKKNAAMMMLLKTLLSTQRELIVFLNFSNIIHFRYSFPSLNRLKFREKVKF